MENLIDIPSDHERKEPLLNKAVSSSSDSNPGSQGSEEDVASLRRTPLVCSHQWWQEVHRQSLLAFPMIYVNVIQYSLQIVSVMFSGHISQLALSGASIATSFASVTGSSLLLGMGSALETLSGQAYGAKNYELLWIFLQRAELVLNATSIPVAILWLNMKRMLLHLGQDPLISEEASEYIYCLIPSLFAYASLQPLVKYLQTQSIIVPMAILSSITFVLHIPLCWLLVSKFGLGSPGSALANSISSWLNVFLLLGFILSSKRCAKSRGSLSWKALNDMNNFIKLAIPSALMICLEYWSFEVLIFLSGLLPNPQLETSILSICLATASLVFMIPYGLSAAASTRISNELGACNAQAARVSTYVSLILAGIEVSVVFLILLLARNILGKAFSDDVEVIKSVSRMAPVLAASTVLDGIQGVLSGVARGCGLQKVGALINLGAYYIVGLPVALMLAFAMQMQGMGLWIGISCGVLVQAILLLVLVVSTNWKKQADAALARVSIHAILQ